MLCCISNINIIQNHVYRNLNLFFGLNNNVYQNINNKAEANIP